MPPPNGRQKCWLWCVYTPIEHEADQSQIPWAGSSTCSTRQRRCTNGAYDNTKSSTFVDVAPNEFKITYVDDTKIAGDYINETFGIGGVTVSKMTMGLAKQSTEEDATNEFQGIVGVGFDVGEAIYSQTATDTQPGVTYPNIVSQLVKQGLIKTRAYSLWLNDRGRNGTSNSRDTADIRQIQTQAASSLVVSTMPNSTATWTSYPFSQMFLVASRPSLSLSTPFRSLETRGKLSTRRIKPLP